MGNPMRLNSTLIAAAAKEAVLQKRTVPKQIEFWAEIGKAVSLVIGAKDIMAVLQGLKKVKVEPIPSVNAAPDDVFDSLEKSRKSGELKNNVTSSTVYFEASINQPGLLDRVDSLTGERQTGKFVNGKFLKQ